MLSTVVATLYSGTEVRSMSRFAQAAQVVSTLRRKLSNDNEPSLAEIIEILRRENFINESLFLSNEEKVSAAQKLLDEGKIITLGCDCYPKMLSASMGLSTPAIFWITDPILRRIQPWNNNDGTQRVCVSAVGSRTPLSIGIAIAA